MFQASVTFLMSKLRIILVEVLPLTMVTRSDVDVYSAPLRAHVAAEETSPSSLSQASAVFDGKSVPALASMFCRTPPASDARPRVRTISGKSFDTPRTPTPTISSLFTNRLLPGVNSNPLSRSAMRYAVTELKSNKQLQTPSSKA